MTNFDQHLEVYPIIFLIDKTCTEQQVRNLISHFKECHDMDMLNIQGELDRVKAYNDSLKLELEKYVQ